MRVLVLLALVLLAGCVAPAGSTGEGALGAAAAAPAPVVVAVIDTGIDPCHVVFRGASGFEAVPGFPSAAPALALSLDAPDYAAAIAQDDALWDTVEPGLLVRFPGTRVAGISFGKDPASPALVAPAATASEHYLIDDAGHGTPVAHSVLAASPHAVVLMIQVPDDEQIADAMRWIAQQPWIDIVSVSSATWVAEYAHGEARMGLPAAYAEAHGAGKLILNGAGNEPLPHFIGEHSGPSFVMTVSGAESASRGETRFAARFPDVISDFVQVRAVHHEMEKVEETAGTSFSTPYVAGVAAEALWLARAEGAAPTADELRAALQAAAEVWGPTDHDPLSDPEALFFSNPILVPGAQMGWGYLAPAHAQAAAGILLGAPAPAKSPDIAAFMAAREQARRAAWGA